MSSTSSSVFSASSTARRTVTDLETASHGVYPSLCPLSSLSDLLFGFTVYHTPMIVTQITSANTPKFNVCGTSWYVIAKQLSTLERAGLRGARDQVRPLVCCRARLLGPIAAAACACACARACTRARACARQRADALGELLLALLDGVAVVLRCVARLVQGLVALRVRAGRLAVVGDALAELVGAVVDRPADRLAGTVCGVENAVKGGERGGRAETVMSVRAVLFPRLDAKTVCATATRHAPLDGIAETLCATRHCV